jgi:dimeric dUTPase (all-alpha-NTP-PPase superfamily)
MDNDNLKIILDKQYRFMTEHNFTRYTNSSREERISMLCTAIIHEAVELQRLCNYKWWKKPIPFDESKAKEEFIDIIHFVAQLALELKLNSDDILNEYNKKHMINIERQLNNY